MRSLLIFQLKTFPLIQDSQVAQKNLVSQVLAKPVVTSQLLVIRTCRFYQHTAVILLELHGSSVPVISLENIVCDFIPCPVSLASFLGTQNLKAFRINYILTFLKSS